MDPKIWGKSGWIFLFSVAMGYPNDPDFQQTNNYKRFFTCLQYVLPCAVCRRNFSDHLNYLPIEPYLSNRKQLVRWVLKVHNMVNQHLGKHPIGMEYVFAKYLNTSDRFEIHFWRFIFSIAYSYPENPTFHEMYDFKRYMSYVRYVLPNRNDRIKYGQMFDNFPIDPYLSSTKGVFYWCLQFHNMLKPNKLWTEKDIIAKYFQ
jgi:hypothetical protein